MNLDDWLHFVHVIAAMTWVGGGFMLSLIGLRARSRPQMIGEFGQTLPFVGLRVLMPAVILVPVTGVWMVLASSEWHFSQLWVRVGLGLFVVAFLIGAVYMSRVGIQMDRASRPGADRTADLRRLLDRWLVGYATVLVVLLLAVADMVFKPGA